MASQSQGVQQLLAAEKKAAEKVAEARKLLKPNDEAFGKDEFTSQTKIGLSSSGWNWNIHSWFRPEPSSSTPLSWIEKTTSGKARRLKQAKDEAQQEIEKFRQEREKQFKEYEAKYLGSQDDVAAKIKKETFVRISEMNKQVSFNKHKVIERILSLVQDIKPELHYNVKI